MTRFGFLMLPLIFLVLLNATGSAQTPTITTYVGPTLPVIGARATTQSIGVPQAVAVDGAGGFYVTSSSHNRVYRVASDGTLILIAGTGFTGFSGDGGPASAALLNYVHGVAVDGAGNVFVADTYNNRIRKITPDGIISTVVGSGAWGSGGDGGPAQAAQLGAPRGLTIDRAGNLFIADVENNRIRMVTPDGVINTVAGNGTAGFSGDGGPATSAQLNYPVAVSVDGAGNLFIADRHNNRIRMVNAAGTIITLTGGGGAGFRGDAGPASSAQIWDPRGVAVDNAGNVFIADSGNNRIRMINAAGIITTVVGNTPGFSGDGGAAASAQLGLPVDVAVDSGGNLFIADRGNYRVRQVNSAGVITSVAGIGDDGGPALAAQLNYPNMSVMDSAGNLFVAETDNQRIRKVTPWGTITTIAGNGSWGFSGDGGPATSAQLNYPGTVAVDAGGNIYIADTRNDRIRKVSPSGMMTTIAGTGGGGFGGDGGPASLAMLNYPWGVTVVNNGNLFVADTLNQRIRRIGPDGIIQTAAGHGTRGFSGDGGPAVSAQLAEPSGVAVDGSGNLFIADTDNERIRKVTPEGIITTVVGNGMQGFSGDGGPALSAQLAYPNSVAVDGAGDLFIADTNNQRIRRVTPDGIITTVAGNGRFGYSGDGAAALAAQLGSPYGVSLDGTNTLLIADSANSRIRKVVFPATSFAITDRGGSTLRTAGNPTLLQTGYGRIQPDAGRTTPAGLAIYSYRPGNYLISETGVPAAPALQSGRIYAEVNGSVNTGLAIANPNGQTATITFFYTDGSGNDVGFGKIVLGSNQQIARFLDSDSFKTFNGNTFQGTFSFTSDMPVGVVAIHSLLNERGDFLMSTLPVVDTGVTPSDNVVLIPHFADGAGWTTQILLVNPTSDTLSGTLEFRADDGTSTNVTIGHDTGSTFFYTVPPRSSAKLVTAGVRQVGQVARGGSFRVIPTPGTIAPVSLVIFSNKTGGRITVSEAGASAATGTAFRVYVESFGGVGHLRSIQSGIAIANNTASPETVTLELTNLDGSTTGLPAPVSLNLPPLGHIAEFFAQAFPYLPAPFRGILRVSSTSDMSAVALRTRYNERGDFLITTTPPTNESAPPSAGELLLPQLADGAGVTTQFVLFSGSAGQSSSGSLLLFQNSGQPFTGTLR